MIPQETDPLSAIDVYRKVSAPAGSYPWAWNLVRLSRFYLLSGQVQPAIAAVRDVSEQMPRGPEKSLALLSLGNCYRRAGQLQDGILAGGQIIDGHYEIEQPEGPVVGQVRVEIREEQDLGFELDDPEAFQTQVPRGQLPRNRVSPRYNANSMLLRTTTADGPNQFDFELMTR